MQESRLDTRITSACLLGRNSSLWRMVYIGDDLLRAKVRNFDSSCLTLADEQFLLLLENSYLFLLLFNHLLLFFNLFVLLFYLFSLLLDVYQTHTLGTIPLRFYHLSNGVDERSGCLLDTFPSVQDTFVLV